MPSPLPQQVGREPFARNLPPHRPFPSPRRPKLQCHDAPMETNDGTAKSPQGRRYGNLPLRSFLDELYGDDALTVDIHSQKHGNAENLAGTRLESVCLLWPRCRRNQGNAVTACFKTIPCFPMRTQTRVTRFNSRCSSRLVSAQSAFCPSAQ
jgi:hypothetical protein